ncbi:probable LRR receptor-like serine/threonine-protein kinase At2g16250 [Rhododendron vialii]|uniref:probable LRR receptor-like serine/threonine-protein kinase At2g16250 n=1 Tax=Rhododendron vialii TaxID=182163 RepID=UPI00265FA501|nr:probable LRR receptor-like serine/threonine-protein kinase At2g16250 [Rhododendron vialii]
MEPHRVILKVSLILLLINSVVTQQNSEDQPAMLDLRSSLGLRARDWPRKADTCSWTGVECQDGRVIEISLSGLRRTRIGRLNPRFAVDSLANLTFLTTFNSSGFLLPGSIQDWFGQRLSALQVLDLSSCSITGPIPISLGDISGLNYLNLSGNSISGTIPSSLGKLSSVSVLDLSGNSLTGSIPSSFSALANLSSLDLSSNFLSGSIPVGFGLLSGLQFLNFQNNSLNGSVPVQLGNLSQLIELDFRHNALVGSLPNELFSSLTRLQYVVLSWNNFDGNLPDELWLMPQLRMLDVSGNNFTGVLPNATALGNAAGAMFVLSNNSFYGTLTSVVLNFHLIDLSNNYFQGPAPSNITRNIGTNVAGNCLISLPNQRNLEDCELFYARRGLTFDNNIAPDSVPPPLPRPASNSKKRVTYVMIGLFGGLGFIVLLVVVLLMLLKLCDKGNREQRTASIGPVPGGSSPPPKTSINFSGLGDSFSYEQMLQATSGFSDANLIKKGHSGDLFHGKLEGGFPVVIKRVDLSSCTKESYVLELEFFGRVSHTRLVPLLGHSLEHENEKLLVYKYMPNGDLSNSLYRFTKLEDDSPQSLDWITRLKIAIGAAEVLCYLHHECIPPLVHRDIQASSILLDDKYEVRLGSLTEVRAQEGDNHQNVITRLLRMPQTSEQGPSGSSSATCAYDVYCFGKVLLELVTGKLGISNSDDVTTKEWLDQNLPYISIYDKDMVAKIVDQSLIVNEDLLEEVWAMAIVAKSCLNPKPSRRPLMRHILRALENPLKVVREESHSSGRLRTTSSRRSWSAAFFGSWRHSSSEAANVIGQTNREGVNESARKRVSSEIFPEPADMQDIERQDGN